MSDHSQVHTRIPDSSSPPTYSHFSAWMAQQSQLSESEVSMQFSTPPSCPSEISSHMDEDDVSFMLSSSFADVPEQQRIAIGWAYETYHVLRHERAIMRRKRRQMLFKAQQYRFLERQKDTTVQSVKHDMQRLIQIALNSKHMSPSSHRQRTAATAEASRSSNNLPLSCGVSAAGNNPARMEQAAISVPNT